MTYDYPDLLENLIDGVYFVDRDKRITYWNRAAEKITGFEQNRILGSRCSDNMLVHVDEQGRNLCLEGCPLGKTMEDTQPREAEVYLRHFEGHRLPVRIYAIPLRDTEGAVVGAAEFFSNSCAKSELKSTVRNLQALALVDGLTRLPNRRHLESQLGSCLQEVNRHNLAFGIVFVDIDDFKRLNDTHGHNVGDRVLRTVGNTLRSIARPYDVIGRWGGEEFLGILRNVDRLELTKIADRIRVLIEKSAVRFEERYLSVTASIGATLATYDDTPASLVERADALMYESKGKGKNALTVAPEALLSDDLGHA